MLSDLIGQPYAVQVMRNYLREGHVSGSFLFLGPARVGKATAAIMFAEAMLCERPTAEPDACGECSSCRSIEAGKHPDVRSVRPTGPSRILRIPQLWPRDGVKDFPPENALLHDLHFAPVRGKRRVFIIEDADSLNDDAANSILKVLEEPPPYATMILTAPNPSSVLPTIFSRCQTLRFTSVTPADIEAALTNRGLADPAEARFISALSQGRIGAAIDLARDTGVRTVRDTVLSIAEQLSSSTEPIRALKLADDLRKAGGKLVVSKQEAVDSGAEVGARQSEVAVLEILAYWYRDLLAIASGADESAVINVDRIDVLKRIASAFAPENLTAAIQIIVDIRRCVERNANAQIAFEALTLNLMTLRAERPTESSYA
jgi:DNA polymerase III subunit delta'